MNNEEYDEIILGSGPAGLQAAIHAVRRKVSVLVLGKLPKSSAHQAHIENFCCIEGESGADLLHQGHIKAEQVGAHFLTDTRPFSSHRLVVLPSGPKRRTVINE